MHINQAAEVITDPNAFSTPGTEETTVASIHNHQRELQSSSLWTYQQQAILNECNDNSCEVTATGNESDFDYEDVNYDSTTSTSSGMRKHFETHIQHKMRQITLKKLRVAKLDSISIPSSAENAQHVVNIKQEFNFPSISKDVQDAGIQTPNLITFRQKTPHPNVAPKNQQNLLSLNRPASFPYENLSNHKLVTADVKPTFNMPEQIGDGIENNSNKIQKMENVLNKTDLEISGAFATCATPVQCVLIKPRKSRQSATPLFRCKKTLRPKTRSQRKNEVNSVSTNHDDESTSVDGDNKNCSNNDITKRKGGKNQINGTINLMPRGGDFTTSEASASSDAVDIYSNHFNKLCSIVDKLQDHEWEVCLDGLRRFQSLAPAINWGGDMGARFIPVISRKLIDFFRSPRSNLCRTACQTAGEFFLSAKSTKRPEFDEMVDILLCRCADPNRFIQKDANVALDKMAMCINIHHSVRAITVKGPDHKNPMVRATAARLLVHICKQAGVEQIVGVGANPRTRKRVLANLGKFLMDKNIETRKHAEKLCKSLKRHKFFMEYFFKETENNSKNSLKKILNNLN